MKYNEVCYCHFSCRRPRGQHEYGIFSCAFFNDKEGKELIGHVTKKELLWEDRQHTTAIQSYGYALGVISDLQGKMSNVGVRHILLVTDNSIVARWILDPKHNKQYAPFMERAVKPYRVGGTREIMLTIGICNPRKYEKAYKYCEEQYVSNRDEFNQILMERRRADLEYRMKVDSSFKPVIDLMPKEEEDKSKVEIGTGIESL